MLLIARMHKRAKWYDPASGSACCDHACVDLKTVPQIVSLLLRSPSKEYRLTSQTVTRHSPSLRKR